jgi:hypothetical protein
MALTKAQTIDRIVTFYGVDALINRFSLTLDPELPPDRLVKQYLRDLRPRHLLQLALPALTDDEIKDMPDVKANRLVRPIRRDLEAAALGEMVELERERAAAKATKEVNDVAPSRDVIDKINTAPLPVPMGPDSPAVMKQWVQGSDGRPEQVDVLP